MDPEVKHTARTSSRRGARRRNLRRDSVSTVLARTFGLVRAGVATALVAGLMVAVPALHRPHVEAELAAAPTVPAFPGAEGFGTQTPGGRGGAVLTVSNLNDSGPGSLRAALTASGPRTVVFRVSGTILLESRINVEDPYLTVAGQTAPGGGITLRVDPAASPCLDEGTMLVATHDVVIRYLRFRPGPTPCADDSQDALTIYKPGTANVVIDHASLSWAVDEVLNTYDASNNITISNSIIAEGLSNSTHPQGEHSKGALIGGVDAHNVSLHGNLFVSNTDRNPQISGLSVADVRNNVIYNYGDGSGEGVTLISSSKGEPRVNWVGNYYKPGPSSDPNRAEFAVYSGTTGDTWQWYGEANQRWTPTGLADARVDSGATASRVPTPFPAAPVTTLTAAAAYDQVLAQAGAAVPYRDPVDQRLVQSVIDGTGQLVDDPSQVGGYPTLPSSSPPADTDGDGMPDNAETTYGTNPNKPDSTGDLDGNGYTNIEDWFNALTPQAPPGPGPTPGPSPSPKPKRNKARIVRVVDGDTVIVRLHGLSKRVQMLGIDAPELPDECYAKHATNTLKRKLPHRTWVTLISDVNQDKKDGHGRLLRYVMKRQVDTSLLQIRRGNATVLVVGHAFTRYADYSRAEEHAKKAHRGIWSHC